VLQQTLLLIFPVAMAFAAANDLFTMRIPNAISLALIAGFVVTAIAAGLPLTDIGWHFAVGAAALLATFGLFQFRILGGGDAKLLAAGSLWMGPASVLPFLFMVAMFGAALSVIILIYRRLVPLKAEGVPGWAFRLHQPGTGIPYGIAIAIGALVVFPSTAIFKALLS
jgi:prepilin peptidase CpaA